ncbi:MAG: DNA polymerase Y family protein [Actinomycetia bacterium]|nr:DNA polymerase Y family protein [Actinomycetes bacterium]
MTVVWCPDWPIIAWGIPLDEPAIVTVANRVIATSPAARAEGVQPGLRRREAQSRCPELAVLECDPDREARLFEPVAAALEAITPRIEVSGPGLIGFPTRGPSRFFGGDHALAEQVLAVVDPVLARRGESRVGIADGIFAARLAAGSTQAVEGPMIVAPGAAAEFLAGFTIDALELPDLTSVLRRLGLKSLGAFAALPPADVVGRFGQEGQLAHRLARGEDDYPPDLRRPAPDLAATWQFEPPAERIEGCAFVAKMLADELHAGLSTEGLACIRVAIEAETEQGQIQLRLWRHEGALSAAAIADRTRWQLDSWLRSTQGGPTSGIARLTLIPDEVVPATGRQLGFWGGRNERADDVTRVVARLQAMLGPEAVSVPEWRGGVGPGERIILVPAAAVDLAEERPATEPSWVQEPWPGQIPAPAPAHIAPDPIPVEVLDDQGQLLGVDGRGEPTGNPILIRPIEAGVAILPRARSIVAWAGPWPADQRWWDPLTHRRRARFQVVLEDGSAHLVALEHQQWVIEATYD